MRTIRFTALLLLLFVVTMTGNGAVLDNFSSPDGWKKGRNHTGEFTCSAETGMTLEHKPGGPGWTIRALPPGTEKRPSPGDAANKGRARDEGLSVVPP